MKLRLHLKYTCASSQGCTAVCNAILHGNLYPCSSAECSRTKEWSAVRPPLLVLHQVREPDLCSYGMDSMLDESCNTHLSRCKPLPFRQNCCYAPSLSSSLSTSQKQKQAVRPGHHIDGVKADERLEQAQVCLCQLIPCYVPLLPQDGLAAVQGLEQLPAQMPCLSKTSVGCRLSRCFSGSRQVASCAVCTRCICLGGNPHMHAGALPRSHNSAAAQ